MSRKHILCKKEIELRTKLKATANNSKCCCCNECAFCKPKPDPIRECFEKWKGQEENFFRLAMAARLSGQADKMVIFASEAWQAIKKHCKED